MADVKELGERLVRAVRDMVARAEERLSARINGVESTAAKELLEIKSALKVVADDKDAVIERASSTLDRVSTVVEAVSVRKGDKGDIGERGERGEKGDAGQRGEKGEQGEKGETGEKGDAGETGIRGEQGETGERGEQGIAGERGEKGDIGIVGEKGDQGIRGEVGERGEKGDAGENGERGEIGERGERGLSGERGEKGETGEQGVIGERGIPGLVGERGEKGETGERGEIGLSGERGEKGEAGLPGERGEKGDIGERGERGLPGDRGERGEKGEEGQAGRDALEIVMLQEIDHSRSYPRGVFAKHAGGIVKSIRRTNHFTGDLEKDGWEVMVEGLADLDIVQDGERTVIFTVTKTSGAIVEKRINLAVPIHRGVYKPETTYEKYDLVTSGGSTWQALKDAPVEKPGDGSQEWRLIVKRGRDGKDGERGMQGERGTKGENGRDLTTLGMAGERYR